MKVKREFKTPRYADLVISERVTSASPLKWENMYVSFIVISIRYSFYMSLDVDTFLNRITKISKCFYESSNCIKSILMARARKEDRYGLLFHVIEIIN